MTGVEIVAACAAEGVALSVLDGERLRYKPTPRPELLDALRANKAAVLGVLTPLGGGAPDDEMSRLARFGWVLQ